MTKTSDDWVVFQDEQGLKWTRGQLKYLLSRMHELKVLLDEVLP